MSGVDDYAGFRFKSVAACLLVKCVNVFPRFTSMSGPVPRNCDIIDVGKPWGQYRRPNGAHSV